MEAMRGKLADQTAIPRAAYEKKIGGEGGGGGVDFGFKDPGGEFVAGDLLIDIAGGLGQQIDLSIRMFAGGEVASILLCFLVLVLAADQLSRLLRWRLT